MSAQTGPPEDDRGRYLGWAIGGILILGVLAVGATFWFIYHPY